MGALNENGNPVRLSVNVCDPPISSRYTAWLDGENGPNVSPTVSAPNWRLARVSPVESMAFVPDALTEDVAPAFPTPPKILGCHESEQLAVCVVEPMAVSVKVVVATALWVNAP